MEIKTGEEISGELLLNENVTKKWVAVDDIKEELSEAIVKDKKYEIPSKILEKFIDIIKELEEAEE